MSVDVWGFPPQQVLTEQVAGAATRLSGGGQQADVAGGTVDDVVRSFRLTYSLVDSATADAMVAFYRRQQGGFRPFGWVNPNDQQGYLVRFDAGQAALGLALFTPLFYQGTTDLVFTVVAS